MNKGLLALIILLLTGVIGFSQNDELLKVIKANSLLSYGGSDLVNFEKETYIVGVAAVEVGTKKISSLTRIGKVKAEQQVSSFVNGSDITSRTEYYLKEEQTTINDSTAVETTETFVEYIREDTEGFVKMMQPAGFWFSEDKSVFYYALYKQVEL